jgi:hypothetical protein
MHLSLSPHAYLFSSNVFSIAFQALPVLLPNAKIIGIESLSFGSSDRDMSHLQSKRQSPKAAPRDSEQEQQPAAPMSAPQSSAKTSRSLTAARRAFNVVRMSTRAEH